MNLLFLSHAQRGHANLAAAVAKSVAAGHVIIPAELGGHQFGISPDEQAVWHYAMDNYISLGDYRTAKATPEMIAEANRVIYMDDADKMKIEKVCEKVEPPKFICLGTFVGLKEIPQLMLPSEVLRREVCALIVDGVTKMMTGLMLDAAMEERSVDAQLLLPIDPR